MATALVIVALTMTTITGICAWVSTRKKAAKFRIKLAAVGVSSDFELEITDSHTPERVRRELREKGVEVR